MNEKRTRQVQRIIRLTEEENQLLKSRIEESPYDTFQNYARHLLLAGEIHFYDYSILHQLLAEVKRIGVNINQVVKAINVYQEITQEDIEELLDYQEELENLVSEKLKEEIRRERLE